MSADRGQPPTAPTDDPALLRIAEAAAAWRARQDEGLSAGELEELLHWLEQDPRHAECFGEMADTWALLDRVREVPLEALQPGKAGAAAASAAAVMATSASTATPAMAAQQFAAAREEAKAAMVRRGAEDAFPDRRRNRWRWVLAGAAAAALLLSVVQWQWRSADDDATVHFAESTPAEAGALRRIDLPDGSVVRLREDSAVDIHLTARQRTVRLLRGEAHCMVAKDAGRPFVVEAQGIGVRAVGTAFAVAQRDGAVEVLVTEGQVRVETARQARSSEGGGRVLAVAGAAGKKALLGAGEKVRVALAHVAAGQPVVPEQLAPEQVAEATAWQRRTLDFDAAPLSAIVAAFNRFNRHQLIVADAALGQRRFGGSFRADDPDGFVAMLAASSQVAVERREHDTVIRVR